MERPSIDGHPDLFALANTGAWPEAANQCRFALPAAGERLFAGRIISGFERSVWQRMRRPDGEVDEHLGTERLAQLNAPAEMGTVVAEVRIVKVLGTDSEHHLPRFAGGKPRMSRQRLLGEGELSFADAGDKADAAPLDGSLEHVHRRAMPMKPATKMLTGVS